MAQHIISKYGIFLILATILSVIGCTQKLSGEYTSRKQNMIDKSVLVLNNDSTFYYRINTDLRGSTLLHGNWRLKRDTVILRIMEPFNDDSLIKKEKVICKLSASNKITVIVQDSVPFTLAKVFINDADTPIELDDHAQAYVKDNIYKVRVQYQGIASREFSISHNSCNDVTVMIYDKQFIPSIYLIAIRKWIVQKRGLIPLNESNLPFKNDIYYKVK